MGPPRAESGPLHVFVVDNDRDTVATMAALLDLAGFRATCFLSGRDALAAAADDPPDAVLLDLAMRGMDGHELARRLGTHAGGRRPLLVAVTGCSRAEDRERAEAAGIDGFFLKPADPDAVVAMLSRLAGLVGRELSERR